MIPLLRHREHLLIKPFALYFFCKLRTQRELEAYFEGKDSLIWQWNFVDLNDH